MAVGAAPWAVLCRGAAATRRLGRRLGEALPPGWVVTLDGPLGAGKTTFVQGFAAGRGVLEPAEVLSPSYALVNEYPAADGAIVHIDFYRLESAEAAYALGLDEQLGRSDAVILVEWASKLPTLLPAQRIAVAIESIDASSRRITVAGIDKPKNLRLPAA